MFSVFLIVSLVFGSLLLGRWINFLDYEQEE